MIKKIVTDITALRHPSILVEKNEDIKELIQDLKDTLATTTGYALAAPQIGINKQVCYIKIIKNIDKEAKKIDYEEIVAINPRIIEKDRKIIFRREGCLSLLGLRIDTDRYVFCIVEYENEKRELQTSMPQDIISFIWQHEIDHLEGRTIIERKHKDINRRR